MPVKPTLWKLPRSLSITARASQAGTAVSGEHFKLICYGCEQEIYLRDSARQCPHCGAQITNEWRQGRAEYELKAA